MTIDRRIHQPPVIHQTGPSVLRTHAEILRETLTVHSSGMTQVARDSIQADIDAIEAMIKFKEGEK
jgi:hypothetical protein